MNWFTTWWIVVSSVMTSQVTGNRLVYLTIPFIQRMVGILINDFLESFLA